MCDQLMDRLREGACGVCDQLTDRLRERACRVCDQLVDSLREGLEGCVINSWTG